MSLHCELRAVLFDDWETEPVVIDYLKGDHGLLAIAREDVPTMRHRDFSVKASLSDKFVWRCKRKGCKTDVLVRDGSFFTKSKLPSTQLGVDSKLNYWGLSYIYIGGGRSYIWITIQIYDPIDIGGSYTWISMQVIVDHLLSKFNEQNLRQTNVLVRFRMIWHEIVLRTCLHIKVKSWIMILGVPQCRTSLQLPFPKTESLKKSFSYSEVKVWNSLSLPSTLRESATLLLSLKLKLLLTLILYKLYLDS